MNNKAFIMFTGTIARMGGAQMYVNNKASFMEKNGYDSYVFSGLRAPILINGLKKHEKGITDILEKFPIVLPSRIINKTIKKIASQIPLDRYNKIIIESNEAHMSVWAELFAQRTGAIHYSFILDEHFNFDPAYIPFFEFKYKRKELLFISKDSPKLFFGNRIKEQVENEPRLSAVCANVVEDIHDSKFDIIDYATFDIRLCHIGRLNKMYVPNVIEGFKKFALNHLDKKICIIFIGNQPEGYKPDMNKLIEEELVPLNNVTVYNMGYVFPIPQSLFDNIDVNVSSAGSSRVSAVRGVLTINMDAKDGNPIGVYGYTTNNNLYRENEPIIPLDTLLNEVCFSDYKQHHHYYGVEDIDETALKKHIDYILSLENDKKYYNVIKINPSIKKNIIAKYATTLLGLRQSQFIFNLFSRIGTGVK